MMIKSLDAGKLNFRFFFEEYRKRFLRSLNYCFKDMELAIILEVLKPNFKMNKHELSHDKVDFTTVFNELDYERLKAFAKNRINHVIIKDLVP